MAIIRSKREHSYTIVSNRIYQKNQLSWQAMGMLGYLLSKPDNWRVVVPELVSVTKDTYKQTGREGVYNIIKELRNKGYLKLKKIMTERLITRFSMSRASNNLTSLIRVSLIRVSLIRVSRTY